MKMLPDVSRCKSHTTDAHKTQTMSPMYAQKPQEIHTSLCVCCLSLAYVTWSMRAGSIKCRLADTLRPRLMLPSRCARSKADACMPWLTVHVVGRLHLPHKDMARPCMQAFANVASH
uniref:Uncharacterized protein n=1 Tax=Solanum lycopersicum TaxID=4081 RepID=A0A3Q7HLA5_SOLLC